MAQEETQNVRLIGRDRLDKGGDLRQKQVTKRPGYS